MAALLCAGLVLTACVTRAPVTTWPWSDWYRQGGAGEMGAFEHQRQACLKQVGISEPGTVVTDSKAENDYLMCMNGAGWCTTVFNCNKPGAS